MDGSRTTLTLNSFIEPEYEVALFSIALIHTLQALGVKSCVIMLHTSYNRKRGEKELERVFKMIKSGAELIKQYSLKNNIRCNCLCLNDNYELIDEIRDVERYTQHGVFNAYFLFDYDEKWCVTRKGYNILNDLPDINVHVRHTKFNFSGGWIPNKMIKSAFLYSQNGTTYSNWKPDELVALISIALIAKIFNEGEGLSRIYNEDNEILRRYQKREIDLFKRVVYLREQPTKLFILGSSVGTYQIYY